MKKEGVFGINAENSGRTVLGVAGYVARKRSS